MCDFICSQGSSIDVVHQAMAENNITHCGFAWVKYRVMWLQSGQAFSIALKGERPSVIIKVAVYPRCPRKNCVISLSTLSDKSALLLMT